MNGMALRRTGKDTNGGGIVLCRYGFGKHRNERAQKIRRGCEQKGDGTEEKCAQGEGGT